MNILLADDDSTIRSSLFHFLTQQGHTVETVVDGREAIEELGRQTFHVVLSDIQMPHVDGIELLKKIRANPDLKETEVVLFTGFGEIRNAVEAIKLGAHDYMLKPIDVEELVINLKRIGDYLNIRREHRRLSENFENEIEKATRGIRQELHSLRQAFAREVGTLDIGIFSQKLEDVFETAKVLHENPDIPVLIEGETGTGKEVVARYVHYGAGDVTTSFVALNCAAITPTLFESELFGYEAGAFTGGKGRGEKGKLELAGNGALFLDEIGELSTDFQAKLLRVIQERDYYRVGGLKPLETGARFICATNLPMEEHIADGTFREDLYYRLSIGHIRVPPLRERKDEIVPLARMFLAGAAEMRKKRFKRLSRETERTLTAHHWPGNIRELKNVIERTVLLHDDDEVRPEHLRLRGPGGGEDAGADQTVVSRDGPAGRDLPEEGIDLEQWTHDIVRRALEMNKWNKTRTAEFLSITRPALYTHLKRMGRKGSGLTRILIPPRFHGAGYRSH